jgi:1-deoxy-D-xylulose-5-phosphate synthase
MRFVKPLDEELLNHIFSSYKKIITIEDGCLIGGFGSAIIEFMADNGYHLPIKRLGIPDRVVEHGEQIELHAECGFDVKGIISAVRSSIAKPLTKTYKV